MAAELPEKERSESVLSVHESIHIWGNPWLCAQARHHLVLVFHFHRGLKQHEAHIFLCFDEL